MNAECPLDIEIAAGDDCASRPLSPTRLFYAKANTTSIHEDMKALTEEFFPNSGSPLDIFVKVSSEEIRRLQLPYALWEAVKEECGKVDHDEIGGEVVVSFETCTEMPDLEEDQLEEHFEQVCASLMLPSSGSRPSRVVCDDYVKEHANVSEVTYSFVVTLFPLVKVLTKDLAGTGDLLQNITRTAELAAYMKKVPTYAPLVDYYFDKDFGENNLRSQSLRGVLSYAMPSVIRRHEPNWTYIQKWQKSFLETGDTDAWRGVKRHYEGGKNFMALGSPFILQELQRLVVNDFATLIFISCGVLMGLATYVRSVFIALAAFFQLIMVGPIGFMGYRQLQYNFAHTSALLAIAVGSHVYIVNIVAVLDSFKFSRLMASIADDMELRMTWVLCRTLRWTFCITLTAILMCLTALLSELPMIRSTGILIAFSFGANFILLYTWFAACLIIYDNVFDDIFGYCWSASIEKKRHRKRGVTQRFLHRLCTFRLSPFIRKHAQKLLLGSCVLAVATGVFVVQGEVTAALGPTMEHHMFTEMIGSSQYFPPSVNVPSNFIFVVWGVKDMNITEEEVLNLYPDDTGTLEWDDGFEFNEDTQEHIWKVCEDLRNYRRPNSSKEEPLNLSEFVSPDFNGQGSVICPLTEWKEWLESQNYSFPVPFEEVGDRFEEFKLIDWTDELGRTASVMELVRDRLGYNDTTHTVQAVVMPVMSMLQRDVPYDYTFIQKEYSTWTTWMEEVNDVAPEGANMAYHTIEGYGSGPAWVWLKAQERLLSSTIHCVLGAVVVVFAVGVLFTFQAIVPVFAVLTFIFTLGSVAAFELLLGLTSPFQRGLYYASDILTFMNTVHVAIVPPILTVQLAYHRSTEELREDKADSVLDWVGSTMLAGAMLGIVLDCGLTVCSFTCFSKLGQHMLSAVIASILWTLFFFMPSLYCFGPVASSCSTPEPEGVVLEEIEMNRRAMLDSPREEDPDKLKDESRRKSNDSCASTLRQRDRLLVRMGSETDAFHALPKNLENRLG